MFYRNIVCKISRVNKALSCEFFLVIRGFYQSYDPRIVVTSDNKTAHYEGRLCTYDWGLYKIMK